jgi:hypothetical protein
VSPRNAEPVLVHLASGIGNIVFATPMLLILSRAGFVVDVVIDADYPGVAELLEGWSGVRTVYDGRSLRPAHSSYARVIAAIPPFYWRRYAPQYARARRDLFRPPDSLFHRDEQAYYLEFARALGCDISDPPYYFLPITPEDNTAAGPTTIVLAPGCKTGEMAAKRWPFFPELADRFEDVVLIGTDDDLTQFDGRAMQFSQRVRSSIGRLSLREAAAVLASAGVVVANDCGLGHIAGALGVPTVLLFGPTADAVLGRLPPNVTVLRRGLKCEPCWFNKRFEACARDIRCLRELTVDEVAAVVRRNLPANPFGKIASASL